MQAFLPSSGRSALRLSQRKSQKLERKLHVPIADRTVEGSEPPLVIVVTGPPGAGKTTLIKSLVRKYTKHSITSVMGPVTVVAGKHRRLTFIECPNDLNAMVDIGKVADLVLFLIDASFGFEMETFEFLNVLQIHGFTKIMGILTHLDTFKVRTSAQRLLLCATLRG
jgi:ribosome biogenesis protein BMS1